MRTFGVVSVVGLALGAYALIAAIVRGLLLSPLNPMECDCGRNPHSSYCDIYSSSIIFACIWPAALPCILFWRYVMVPWWENIVKPVAAWSESVFAKKPEDK